MSRMQSTSNVGSASGSVCQFKKANSFTATSSTKITEKMSQKKDLDKLYPISDDDSSDNEGH